MRFKRLLSINEFLSKKERDEMVEFVVTSEKNCLYELMYNLTDSYSKDELTTEIKDNELIVNCKNYLEDRIKNKISKNYKIK